jgi:hypothetical protein
VTDPPGADARTVPELAAAIHEAREASDPRAAVVAELRYQAAGCAEIGSPLYAHLLEQLAASAAAGGIAWRVLEHRAADPPFSALGLRLMAAVHRLVLAGRAPGLAAFYPSAGGGGEPGGAWEAFARVLAEEFEDVVAGVDRPCQTNEPGRAAALLGGFLSVAAETGLPLRVLEVGASAGLNLRWDHFRYIASPRSWGDAASPVVFDGVFESAPPLEVAAVVAERRGCDANPLDPLDARTQLNLRASAWPDQPERLATLQGALEVAGRVPAVVDRADGPAWVEAQLARHTPGLATVVYHSIVLQYLTDQGRARLRDVITAAGERATADAPLAWLSMEPGGAGRAHVNLSTWPGGRKRLVATAGYHGRPVRWLEVAGEAVPGTGAY